LSKGVISLFLLTKENPHGWFIKLMSIPMVEIFNLLHRLCSFKKIWSFWLMRGFTINDVKVFTTNDVFFNNISSS